MSSALTVKEPAGRLILQGDRDIALTQLFNQEQVILGLKQQEKLARTKAKMEARIQLPINQFLDYFCKKYSDKLGKERFTELIRNFNETQIEALADQLAVRARPGMVGQMAFLHSCNAICLTVIFNSIFSIFPHWITILPLYVLVGLFAVSGPLLPMIYLCSLFDCLFESEGMSGSWINNSWRYLRQYKHLKKLYGKNYFPHKKLREKLNLAENTNQVET
ncbi:MAG: hypothetical protein A3J46_05560 [Candidatus Yanofskybacteria bacterium RIFCSPHIGHO2_02_FULL_41_11]|uniref:Uncharacterized protein n=1 Tax=Candidatus Yanofskybacteria bacterium RIFCSPHIGHO2_02_FULL_41_11 TaxID=1802675 RepID=A0A1F8FBS2_9BACT|nr:MAG: hypothetical protein A3J46_05560 [Candidatus Yanofskybacteria bacterium RIFCSPHIGHO2_02_FULL_41_11]